MSSHGKPTDADSVNSSVLNESTSGNRSRTQTRDAFKVASKRKSSKGNRIAPTDDAMEPSPIAVNLDASPVGTPPVIPRAAQSKPLPHRESRSRVSSAASSADGDDVLEVGLDDPAEVSARTLTSRQDKFASTALPNRPDSPPVNTSKGSVASPASAMPGWMVAAIASGKSAEEAWSQAKIQKNKRNVEKSRPAAPKSRPPIIAFMAAAAIPDDADTSTIVTPVGEPSPRGPPKPFLQGQSSEGGTSGSASDDSEESGEEDDDTDDLGQEFATARGESETSTARSSLTAPFLSARSVVETDRGNDTIAGLSPIAGAPPASSRLPVSPRSGRSAPGTPERAQRQPPEEAPGSEGRKHSSKDSARGVNGSVATVGPEFSVSMLPTDRGGPGTSRSAPDKHRSHEDASPLECDSDGKEDIPTHAQIRRTALTPQPPSTLPPKPAVQVVVTQTGDVMVPGTKRGPDIIWEGDILLKFPYSYAGAPKKRWFQVVSEAVGKDAKKIEKQRKEFDKVVAKMAGKGGRGPLPQVQSGISLVWSNPKAKGEKPRSMLLCEVTDLRRGHRTPVFWQHVNSKSKLPPETLCFSVVSSERTVDVACTTEEQCVNWLHGLMVAWSMARKASGLGSALPPTVALKLTTIAATKEDVATTAKPPTTTPPLASVPPQAAKVTVAVEGGDASHKIPEDNLTRLPTHLPRSRRSSDSGWSYSDRLSYWSKTLFDHVRANRKGDVMLAFEEGCPVDLMEEGSGDTALLVAARCGWVDIARLCLDAGSKNDPHPQFGKTALQIAIDAGQSGVARLLLKAAQEAGMHKSIANHIDDTKSAPLHVAARYGDHKCLLILLEFRADPTLVDAKGRNCLHIVCAFARNVDPADLTPLDRATGRRCQSGFLACAQVLLEGWADYIMDSGDFNGNTPLMLASKNGNLPLVELLLQTAANPNFENAAGKSASSIAGAAGHSEIVRLLQLYEASPKSSFTSDRPSAAQPAKTSGNAVLKMAPLPEGGHSQSPAKPRKPRSSTVSVQSSEPMKHSARKSNVLLEAALGDDEPTNVSVGSGLFSQLDVSEGSSGYAYSNTSGDATSQSYGTYPQQAMMYPQQGYSYDAYGQQYITVPMPVPMQWGTVPQMSMMAQSDPWQLLYTEEGHAYYLNSVTGVSQWEDPWSTYNTQSGYSTDGTYPQTASAEGGQWVWQAGGAWEEASSEQTGEWVWVSDATPFESAEQTPLESGATEPPASSHADDDGVETVALKETVSVKAQSSRRVRTPLRPSGVPQLDLDKVASARRRRNPSVPSEHVIDEGSAQSGARSDDDGEEFDDTMSAGGLWTATDRSLPEPSGRPPRGTSSRTQRTTGRNRRTSSGAVSIGADESSVDGDEGAGSWDTLPSDNRGDESMDAGRVVKRSSTNSAGKPRRSVGDIQASTAPPPAAALPVLRTKVTAVPSPSVTKLAASSPSSSQPASKPLVDDKSAKPVKETPVKKPEPTVPIITPIAAPIAPPPPSQPRSTTTVSSASTPTLPPPQSQPPARDFAADPAFNKYFHMYKVGLGDGAVSQRMAMDGVDNATITEFIAARNGGGSSAPTAAPSPAPASVEEAAPGLLAQKVKDAIKADPKFAKYTRMCSVGVPLGAVRAKMSEEGLSEADITLFMSAFASTATVEALGMAPPATQQSASAAAASARRLSKTPMLKLHWNQVPQERLESSVWSTPRDAPTSLGEDEVKQLEALFAAKTAASAAVGAKATEAADGPKKVSIVEFKRAYNVSIALAQFKAFPTYTDLLQTVFELDASKLPVEKLEQLLDVLPNDTEVKSVLAYNGDRALLGECETWFLAAAAVNRASVKVSAGLFMLQFTSQAHDIQRRLDGLARACKQVIDSVRLRAVLETILAIGNIMNEGTHKGGAQGFTLDSLPALAATKGVDGKTTLMDYLAVMVEKKDPELLNFAEELSLIPEARRFVFSDLKSEVAKLKSKLTSLQTEAASEARDIDGESSSGAGGDVGTNASGSATAKLSSSDPRANMLAEMMAKRAGGAAAAPKPSTPSSTVNTLPHPCSKSQRLKFVEKLEDGVRKITPDVDCLSSSCDAVAQWGIRAAQYFAEDPASCPPERICEVLHTFCALFDKSRQSVAKKREAEERKARRASMHGGSGQP